MVRLFSLYIKPTSHGNSTQKYRLPIGRLLIWESLKYSFPQNPTILRIRASPVKSDTTLVLSSSSSSSWCLPSRESSPFRRRPRAFSSTSSPPQKFRKVARELSDPFSPSPSRSCVRARARRLCSAAARHRAASYRAQNPILRRRADWSSEPPPRGRSVAPPPSSNHLGASRRGRGTRRPVSPSLALVSARSCSPSPPPRHEPPRSPLRP